jgi:ADP-heptose:LPS heptosyltransferase
MVPDERKRALWGEKLRFLDHGRSRPNIGIAWQGGVETTRFAARSFPPETYLPMMGAVDANWISLQYDTTAQECVDRVRANHGVKIHHWPEAVEAIDKVTKKNRNIDDLVALISRLDLVVSVCQTAVHIAGALGVPCLCLTTSEPSWRYGVGGRGENEDMPWYGSVKLIRQERGMRDWAQAIEDATANVLAFNTCRERERAHYG